jgi:hypothetical protein
MALSTGLLGLAEWAALVSALATLVLMSSAAFVPAFWVSHAEIIRAALVISTT